MNSPKSFIEHIPWTPSEKKVARKAFDQAFERQCASIKAEAEKMIANVGAHPTFGESMITSHSADEP